MYKFLKPIGLFLMKILMPFKILGKEKLKTNNNEKGVMYICNHYGLTDVIMLSALNKKKIHFVAKKEIFNTKIGNWFFRKLGALPADRNNLDIRMVMDGIKLLKNGEIMGIFPEGTRNKTTAELLPLKGGAGIFSIKSKTPIQPVAMVRKSKFFRKNYLLVGETFELTEYYDKKLTAKDYDEISDIIKDKILSLKFELRNILKSKGIKI